MVHADVERGSSPAGDGQTYQHTKDRLLECKLHLVRHSLPGAAHKPGMLPVFLSERFNDTNRADYLLDERHRRAVQPFDRVGALANDPAGCSRVKAETVPG